MAVRVQRGLVLAHFGSLVLLAESGKEALRYNSVSLAWAVMVSLCCIGSVGGGCFVGVGVTVVVCDSVSLSGGICQERFLL